MKASLILPFLLSGAAWAQSPGTFTPTGSMITPRFGHTATLLPDGKVLIAGGTSICFYASNPALAQTQLRSTIPLQAPSRLPAI